MITKVQVTQMRPGTSWEALQEFHYTGRHECSRKIGPRGGVTEHVTRVRRSGKTQTWKTRPEDFRVPIKYGLYESGEITQANAHEFHAAEDCPINKERY